MIKVLMFIMALLTVNYSAAGKQQLRVSGANQITFSSGVTKDFVGSAFLIKHGNKNYAVTAKHVLLETMDQGIDAIAIHEHVTNWRITPFNENTGEVKLGKLLNSNQQEALDIKVLQDDWLVFDVKANDSALKPLKFAQQPLSTGDKVSVYGCNYSNQSVCNQDHYSGTFVKQAGLNLLIKLELQDLTQLRGLSGAPVLNSKHEVVGIVSNVIPDEENGGMFFAPFTTQPLMKFLDRQ